MTQLQNSSELQTSTKPWQSHKVWILASSLILFFIYKIETHFLMAISQRTTQDSVQLLRWLHKQSGHEEQSRPRGTIKSREFRYAPLSIHLCWISQFTWKNSITTRYKYFWEPHLLSPYLLCQRTNNALSAAWSVHQLSVSRCKSQSCWLSLVHRWWCNEHWQHGGLDANLASPP